MKSDAEWQQETRRLVNDYADHLTMSLRLQYGVTLWFKELTEQDIAALTRHLVGYYVEERLATRRCAEVNAKLFTESAKRISGYFARAYAKNEIKKPEFVGLLAFDEYRAFKLPHRIVLRTPQPLRELRDWLDDNGEGLWCIGELGRDVAGRRIWTFNFSEETTAVYFKLRFYEGS